MSRLPAHVTAQLGPAIDDVADAEKARLGWARFPGSRCPRYSEDWDAWGNSGFFGDIPRHPVWAHEDGRRLCETCAAPEMWLSALDRTGTERALLGHLRCRVCGEWEAEIGGREPANPGCWAGRWLRQPDGGCRDEGHPDGPCEDRCALDHPRVAEAAHRLLVLCEALIDDDWFSHDALVNVGPWVETTSLHSQSDCKSDFPGGEGRCRSCLPAEAEDAYLELTRAVYEAVSREGARGCGRGL